MSDQQNQMPRQYEEDGLPQTNKGNASNPPPTEDSSTGNQLLGRKAEKYLREGGNIEDMPDAEERQELDDATEPDQG